MGDCCFEALLRITVLTWAPNFASLFLWLAIRGFFHYYYYYCTCAIYSLLENEMSAYIVVKKSQKVLVIDKRATENWYCLPESQKGTYYSFN